MSSYYNGHRGKLWPGQSTTDVRPTHGSTFKGGVEKGARRGVGTLPSGIPNCGTSTLSGGIVAVGRARVATTHLESNTSPQTLTNPCMTP